MNRAAYLFCAGSLAFFMMVYVISSTASRQLLRRQLAAVSKAHTNGAMEMLEREVDGIGSSNSFWILVTERDGFVALSFMTNGFWNTVRTIVVRKEDFKIDVRNLPLHKRDEQRDL